MVVGLGNPGAKYSGTRHNVGFDCLDALLRRAGNPTTSTKFEGQVCKTKLADTELLLIWPMTFMNASGRCVKQFANFYKIQPVDILVICDDLALPLGKLRIRSEGSSGGQKGLENILQSLGTTAVPRLRLGIEPCPERWEVADYVLSRFREDEKTIMELSVARATDAVCDWASRGIDYCMNQYNRRDV